MPVSVPVELESLGVAEGLELSVGEPDPVGLGEEVSVGVDVGVVVVGVADGDVVVGVAVGDDESVPVGVAVADGLVLAVWLGLLDGAADGQGAAVGE